MSSSMVRLLFVVSLGGCSFGAQEPERCSPEECLDEYLFSDDVDDIEAGLFQLRVEKPFPFEPRRRERLRELAAHPEVLNIRATAFMLGEQTDDLEIMVQAVEATSTSPAQAARLCLDDVPAKLMDKHLEPCSYWGLLSKHCETTDQYPEICAKWGKDYLDWDESDFARALASPE